MFQFLGFVYEETKLLLFNIEKKDSKEHWVYKIIVQKHHKFQLFSSFVELLFIKLTTIT